MTQELTPTEAKQVEQPRILHLNLKKKWFDMILSGEKKEEYREWKPYWAIRFLKQGMKDVCATYAGSNDRWEHFDAVVFKNGYTKNAPTMKVEVSGIKLGNGRPEWGATNRCIIIKLGKIISTKNLLQSI